MSDSKSRMKWEAGDFVVDLPAKDAGGTVGVPAGPELPTNLTAPASPTTDDLSDPEVRKLAALRAYLAGDLATFEALTDLEFKLDDPE